MLKVFKMRRPDVVAAVLAMLAATVVVGFTISGAFAASVGSATFNGGTGTVSVSGTLFAKQGATVTLTVMTSADTKCVELTGAHEARQTSNSAKGEWTFPLTAGSGNGVQTVTAAASPNFNNNNNNCTGQSQSPKSASYTLDNAAPTVTATLAPAPNAAGWNKANVGITWSASDAGAGVASGPSPATDSQGGETAGVAKTATATDRLGHTGSGQVSVKLDKTIPSIDATRAPAPNTAGWNNSNVAVSFNCSDTLSGIKSCTGGGSVTLTEEGAGQSVPGQAVDNADNVNAAGVTNINIDKTPPALSGSPVGEPTGTDAQGVRWYKDEVTIAWTASDGLSGLASAAPANSRITSEGKGVFASASVSDKAANTTNADSAKVNVDATAPNTNATAPTGWTNSAQTVMLVPNDALSGVKATHYSIDGGAERIGTSVEISGDGVHTLEYYSVDHAGNVESRRRVEVKIDGTTPRISHSLSPLANGNGWNNSNVTVRFVCSDETSGIASCTADQVVSTEGASQIVEGTAVDGAANRAHDPASVSLDKTPPVVAAKADRTANGAGWYDDDVTVAFTAQDALSGIARVSAATVLGEGANQSARGSATDAADNSASAELTGINVDKTAPELSGAPTTAANAAGWYDGDVTIAWTASDALSGLAGAAPADSTITGEGDDLRAGASVSDKAGNTRHATRAVKIDRTAPTTSATVPKPLASGWYAGEVEVTLEAIDSLSGVKAIYYSVDGGEQKLYEGRFLHALRGAHTITFWSEDVAGNRESRTAPAQTITLKIDGTPPTIVGKRFPAPNEFGWVNTDVDVVFECSDEESGLQSGVAGCDPGTRLVNEGSDLEYTGSALDLAGNQSSATVKGIKIDKTPPTLAGAATTQANAANWYRGDVTVRWTGQDGLSGIDPASQPGDSTITGEGRDLGAGPASIRDKAGNVSAPASVSGIRIDRTAPVISGGATTPPNAAGWYNAAVTVAFSCADSLSGCEANGAMSSKVLLGNGAGQSVTSDSAEDLAGNRASGKTVGGINIDGQAPQSSADNRCDAKNGWCRGQTATLILTAGDQDGLSGVREIRYSVNGNPEQAAAGASATVQVPLAAKSGTANVTYHAVDNAGNVESTNGVALKYDNIAPTVTHTLSPVPNANSWNSSHVVVRFEATDDDGGSGVDHATVTPDVAVASETPAAGQVVKGSALDLAGNLGTDQATVKLDRTAPAITAAIVAGTKGAGDWYTSAVTVRFTCSDALSGIATCPADEVITANGSGQSASGRATDKAGNTASATVEGINIDSTKPAITVTGVRDGGVYTLGDVPAGSCSATDNLAPSVDCSLTVTGGRANGVGTFTYTARATDVAGNAATSTGSYRVIYKWEGFRQPINDTAHQIGTATSVFKAASTVPAKLQLKRADGSLAQATVDPAWLTPVKGGSTAAAVDESLYAEPATTGGAYRWDATNSQYIYNWGTSKANANYYWRIGVSLDDGQTYYVNIGLR